MITCSVESTGRSRRRIASVVTADAVDPLVCDLTREGESAMRYAVVDARESARGRNGQILLRRLSWNDWWQFKTTFYVIYVRPDGRTVEIGSVKVAKIDHPYKIGIGVIDEFIGKLIDVGAVMGVLYTGSGFSKNAIGRAVGQRIPQVQLRVLDPSAPVPDSLPPSSSAIFDGSPCKHAAR